MRRNAQFLTVIYIQNFVIVKYQYKNFYQFFIIGKFNIILNIEDNKNNIYQQKYLSREKNL